MYVVYICIYATYIFILSVYPTVHGGYSQLCSKELNLIVPGNLIRLCGSNLCWLCARQSPYLLYYCSDPKV